MQIQEKERIAQELREKGVNEEFMFEYEEAKNELYDLQNKKIAETQTHYFGTRKKGDANGIRKTNRMTINIIKQTIQLCFF